MSVKSYECCCKPRKVLKTFKRTQLIYWFENNMFFNSMYNFCSKYSYNIFEIRRLAIFNVKRSARIWQNFEDYIRTLTFTIKNCLNLLNTIFNILQFFNIMFGIFVPSYTKRSPKSDMSLRQATGDDWNYESKEKNKTQ